MPTQYLQDVLKDESPLQIVGTINANAALLAKNSGFKAIYLSGGGVASASLGIPDLGMSTCADVLEDVRRIRGVCDLPLLVDIDTGWGHFFSIQRSIKALEAAGVSAVHIEDQVAAKRCGHRPGKALVPTNEMQDRIKACVDAKESSQFAIMARTDAYASEGLKASIERSVAYVAAGADMIFAEALKTQDDYSAFVKAVKVPVLANITEFGQTPLFTVAELKSVGVAMVLYPLSAFRAMSQAAKNVYEAIRADGTQKAALETMQTREALYETIDYHRYEKALDKVLSQD